MRPCPGINNKQNYSAFLSVALEKDIPSKFLKKRGFLADKAYAPSPGAPLRFAGSVHYSPDSSSTPVGAPTPFRGHHTIIDSSEKSQTPIAKVKSPRPRKSAPGGFTPETPISSSSTSFAAKQPLYQDQLPLKFKNDKSISQPRLALPDTPRKQGLKPLIPEYILESGYQRFIVLILFSSLQAMKLYDMFIQYSHPYNDRDLNICFKYTIIDILFLNLLPLFRIPWLSFRPAIAFALSIFFSFMNFLLVLRVSIPFTLLLSHSFHSSDSPQIALSEKRVNLRKLKSQFNRISGHFEITVLPESTAVFNPYNEIVCVSPTSEASLPLRMNSSEPKLVQWEYYSFDTKLEEPEIVSITGSAIRKRLNYKPDAKDPSISYLHIPISAPGLYRVIKILDDQDLDIHLIGSSAFVPSCPSAAIVPQDLGSPVARKCLGETYSPIIIVEGVPPLNVRYRRIVAGRTAKFDIDSVQPDDFVPIEMSKDLIGSNLLSDPVDVVSRHRPHNILLEVDGSLNTAGRWSYIVEQVSDAFGNTVDYSTFDSNSNEFHHLRDKNLVCEIDVISRPSIYFTGCDAENPLKITEGASGKLSYKIDSGTEPGPFEVEMEYVSEDQTQYRLFNVTSKDEYSFLNLQDPGKYRILSIQGRYCGGLVRDPAQCAVVVAPRPELDVSFEEITDPCAGSVGITAELSLSGTPPFRVSYRILLDGKNSRTETLKIDKTRHKLEFKSEKAGKYTYEFFSLSDQLYPVVSLDPKTHSASQTFLVLADAKFKQKEQIRTCSNEAVTLDVLLRGNEPFSLTYEIVHSRSRKSYTIDNINSSEYSIRTPEFQRGGQYRVNLVSIQDGKGCKRLLSGEEAVVEVRRERPSVGFRPNTDGSYRVSIREDEHPRLNLRLMGEKPWEIQYRRPSGDTESVRIPDSSKAYIPVDTPGIYKLISVKDKFCEGAPIHEFDEFEVLLLPRPSVTVKESDLISQSVDFNGETVYHKANICEGTESFAELQLTGKPPFSILYSREKIGVKRSRVTDEMGSGTTFASLRLQGNESGHYQYIIYDIFDSQYESGTGLHNLEKPIRIMQEVSKRPDASFEAKGRTFKSCIDSPSGLDPIILELSGEPPFTATLHIVHTNTGRSDQRTIRDINDFKRDIRNELSDLDLGLHTVSISAVIDNRGCSQTWVSSSDFITIHMVDKPSIIPLSNSKHACVGDTLAYSLTGEAPFSVEYIFDGVSLKANTGPRFSRVATQPGNFSIVSIEDITKSCKLFVEDASITIHDLPSVSMMEGDTHIREGDHTGIVFTFTGTPPFSFQYTRSERVGNSNQYQVVDTYSVTGIQEFTYTVWTSVQGFYQPVAVEDRYCAATT
ncbi:hypothetical protein CANCADRAFT_4139 [Tortispora caseinolytica NRRL Y-17796]|uniref:Nucleoporin Pom152 n=1 Tax=Tortispora caseinolytica NRRL Y-17796 TaxID=767744 RepID=A0A1E4TCT6_9ASCO|nr:hypothetical protein CANCADRAFT_4139 [Tortispora caseinolytica NRRL Y-17796]